MSLNKISFSFKLVPVLCIVGGSDLKSCTVRPHSSRSRSGDVPPPPPLAAVYPDFEIYRLENVISSVNHSKREIDSNV